MEATITDRWLPIGPAALAVALGGLLLGCGIEPHGPRGSDGGQRGPGDIRNADRARGRNLYVTACAGCHALYPPEAYTAAEWTTIVRRHRHRRTSLSAEQMAEVERYLLAASKEDEDRPRRQEPGSPGGP